MKQLAIPVLAVLLVCACGCTPTQRGAVAGAAIGAAGGAATSAIAGGDAVTGALIGGAIGTAGGAIVGAQHENDEYDDYYYDIVVDTTVPGTYSVVNLPSTMPTGTYIIDCTTAGGITFTGTFYFVNPGDD